MDSSLHFVLTGDDSQLIETLEHSRKALDGLEEISKKAGVSLGDALSAVSQHLQSTSDSSQALKDSMTDASQAIENGTTSVKESAAAYDELSAKSDELAAKLKELKKAKEDAEDEDKIKEIDTQILDVRNSLGEVLDKIEKIAGYKIEIAKPESAYEAPDATTQTEETPEEKAERIKQMNAALVDTKNKLAEITSELNQSGESFQKLINTAQQGGSDNLRLAENKDKIDAINERLHALDAGYSAAADRLNAINAALAQAIKDGDTAQADALTATAEKVLNAKNQLEKQTDDLIKVKQKLEKENEEIKKKSQEVVNNAQKMPSEAGKGVQPTVDKFAKLKEAMSGVGTGFGQVMGGFKSMVGGGASAARGLAMVTSGFKTLTATIMSNPIGAIIGAIVLSVQQLVKAFKRNEDAMAGLQKAAAPFKAIWQTIQRLFNDIVTTIMNVAKEIKNTAGSSKALQSVLNPLSAIIKAIRTHFAIWSTIMVDVAKTIRVIVNGFDSLRRSIVQALSNTKVGKWIQDIKNQLFGFFDGLMKFIEKVANSRIGKKLGFDNLYNQIKEIRGAQEELTKANQKIAEMELSIAKKERDNLTANAKIDAELVKLRRQYAEASGDVLKQEKIAQQITAQEKAKKRNELDLAKQELELINTKYSLLKDTNLLTEKAQKEAAVIRLQAEYDYGMSSQERRTSRTSVNEEYRKAKSELDSERDLRLEAYKQQKIDARDNRDELQKIEMEEFEFKQEMKKKELELQLKYHKITQQDYELQLNQMAEAAKTHKKEVEAGNFDYFRNARIKLDNGVENKNRQEEVKAEVDALKERLKYEKDLTERLRIQSVIREKNLELELESIEKEKRNKIREVYKEDGLRQYDEGKLNDVVGVVAAYDERERQARDKAHRQGVTEDFQEDYKAYLKYCEDVIAAEEWKQEELRKIAVGESNMSKEDVDTVYKNQVDQAAKYANLDAAELKLTSIAEKFQDKIAYATVQGIEEAYEELETAITGENNLIDKIMGMTDEQKAARTEELNEQLSADQAIAKDETQDPNVRAEAEERILSAQREILLLSYDQQQLDGQKIKNTEVLDRMRKKANDEEKKANDAISVQTIKNVRNMHALGDSLGMVADMADAVADTFGGALSKKAKKALGAISDIAKTGQSVIGGIENLVNTATKGMTVTAAAGVQSMSALEKASFILTILSVAVQAITAIVQFLMKFTAAAQMQDLIDEHLDRVKELEYEHDKLERAYQNSYGTEYYKNLAKAAKDYDKIIQEQNAALAEAQELYEYQKNKYGEDSGKAKDAKEQMQEIEAQLGDYEDAQRSQFQELMEELSGTDLKSFAQSLADSLVEGFKMGKDGIEDVWEDTMDDLMRTMMKQQLALAIEDMFAPVFDQLNDYTKNGELNQSEIDAIMAEFDAKSAQAKNVAEQYYNLMNERGLLEDGDTEGSQGFGQMTQDQADTLTARFTALQIEGSNIVAATQLMLEQVMLMQGLSERQTTLLQSIDQYQQLAFQQSQEHLDQLQVIADNTALLAETNSRLKAIEQNTDKL